MAARLEKDRVLAWLLGFEAARQADRARLRQEPIDRQRSVRLALGLMKLIHAHGEPAIEDSSRAKERVLPIASRAGEIRLALLS